MLFRLSGGPLFANVADRRDKGSGGKRMVEDGKQRVGFVGVGLMGHGIAKNLVAKGYPLTVLAHRNRKPVEDLMARGATEARSAAELAGKSDVIFLCVTGSPQVEDAMFRADGLLAGLRPGTIVADCSTADPTSTLKVAAAVAEKGGRFVDTPLTRTPKEAEEGRLVVMAGGDAATLDEIRPLLGAFAETVIHAGPVGAGHKVKLINNFIALGGAALIAEAVCAAIKVGVDLKALAEVVTGGGGDSVMFRRFAKYFLEGDDSSLRFVIDNACKDLRYYTHMAETAPTTAFLAEAAHQTYVMASNLGHGDKFVLRLLDALGEINGARLPAR